MDILDDIINGSNKEFGSNEDIEYIDSDYDLLSLLDKSSKIVVQRNIKMSKLVIGYTAVTRNKAKLLIQGEKLNMKSDLVIIKGNLGSGMYFYEDNIEYIKYIAKRDNLVPLGVLLDLQNSLDLTKNELQSYLNLAYKALLEKGIDKDYISDTLLFDEFRDKYRDRLDSVIGISVSGELFRGSRIWQYMSKLICIYNRDCILKYFNPLDKDSINRVKESIK